MIRLATLDDLPAIRAMGAKFHAMSPYAAIPFDADAFERFAGALLECGVVLLSDDGMIGGMLNGAYFNPAILLAAELFWWAPSEGRALREAFEAWAKDRGAWGVQFSGLANERAATVTKLFQRAGYEPCELAFLKRL